MFYREIRCHKWNPSQLAKGCSERNDIHLYTLVISLKCSVFTIEPSHSAKGYSDRNDIHLHLSGVLEKKNDDLN